MKEDPDCAFCFGNDNYSIFYYYENLKIFLQFRAELWSQLIRFSVMDKLLTSGRLIVVCLPEAGCTVTVAVLLKVRKSSFKNAVVLKYWVCCEFSFSLNA